LTWPTSFQLFGDAVLTQRCRCSVRFDLRSGLKLSLEMSREPEGQGDNRQGWIGKTARRKNRTTSDEEIPYFMHSTIRIDYTVPRIVVHPSSTQKMMGLLNDRG
jgi:hypothetical protein